MNGFKKASFALFVRLTYQVIIDILLLDNISKKLKYLNLMKLK